MARQTFTLVHNENAGDSGWTQQRILAALAEHGFDAVADVSADDADLPALLAEARGLVIVAGGDGTVGRVAKALGDPDAVLAIVPTGGANNIARSLGIPADPEAAIRTLAQCHRGALRIGRITGTPGERKFVESIGLGPTAESAQKPKDGVPSEEKRVRVRGLIRDALAEADPIVATVVIDGQSFREPALMIEVMNIPLAGPNLAVAPGADPGEADLVVAWLPVAARREMVDWLVAPDHAPPPLVWRRGRRVALELKGEALRLDDDAIDRVDGTVLAELRGAPVAVLTPKGKPRDG